MCFRTLLENFVHTTHFITTRPVNTAPLPLSTYATLPQCHMPLFSPILTHLLAPHSFLVGLVCFLCLLLDTQHNTTLQHNTILQPKLYHNLNPPNLTEDACAAHRPLLHASVAPVLVATVKYHKICHGWGQVVPREQLCADPHTTWWRNMSAGRHSSQTSSSVPWHWAERHMRCWTQLLKVTGITCRNIYVWHNVWQIY